jgi:hypothetical protein
MELTMPFDMAVRIAAHPVVFMQTTKQVEIAKALADAIEQVRHLCVLAGTYSDAEALASEILDVIQRNPS